MLSKSPFIIKVFCTLIYMVAPSAAYAANILTIELTTASSEPIKLSVSDDLAISVIDNNITVKNSDNETTMSVDDIKSFRYIMEEQNALSHPSSTPQNTLQWNGKNLSIKGSQPDDICKIITVDGKILMQVSASSIADIDFSRLDRGIYMVVMRNFPVLKIAI